VIQTGSEYVSVGKYQEEKSLGGPRRRGGDNIKVEHKGLINLG
jgi:hypothetical protein